MSPRPDLGPKPRLGYASSRIDRAAARRTDAVALAALEQTADARAYAIAGELVILRKTPTGPDPLFVPAAARQLGAATEVAYEVAFLGLHDGAPRFAVALTPAVGDALKSDERFIVSDLRSIAVRGLVEAEHLPPLAEGKALLGWHARHRFCPNCGAATAPVDGGWRRDCAACKAQHFPRTDPVVIMLATAGDRCLLGRSHRFQAGMWSCLAGFVEPGETIEEAVRREILEEAAIVCGRVGYFASQPWPFPSSLMIGCYAQAQSHDIVVDRGELDDARWFDREEVALMIARSHPDGFTAPQPVAIAYHIIRGWVEDGVAFG
jgi:NAD+ diphosphatase